MTQYLANMMKNPSCETNSDGYTTIPGTSGVVGMSLATIAPFPAAFNAGLKYLHLTWTTATTTNGGGVQIGHATTAGAWRIDITPGQAMSVSVWVRTNKVKSMQVTPNYYNSSGTLVGTGLVQAFSTTVGGWVELRTEGLSAPAGGVRLVLLVQDIDATRFLIGDSLDVIAVQVWPGPTNVRYNLATDPNGTAIGPSVAGQVRWGNERGFGTGGSGTHSLVTAGTSGPRVSQGQYINSYVRKTWTVASSNSTDSGFQLASSSTAGQVIGAGQPFNASAYLRASVAHGTSNILVNFYTSGGTFISSANGANTPLLAGVWARQMITGVTPATTAYIQVIAEIDGAEIWPIGATLDGTGLFFSQQASTDFFSGSTPSVSGYDGLLRCSWAATANNSSSYMSYNALPPYSDADSNPMMVWAGTPHASIQYAYNPEVSATYYYDDGPMPRAVVTVLDVPPGTFTLYRSADSRVMEVRDAARRASVVQVSYVDLEIPFGVPVTYYIQAFTPAGVDLGSYYAAGGAQTMAVTSSYIHQPLDPFLCAKVDVYDDSAEDLTRGFDGEVIYADSATVGRWLGGRRRGLEGLSLTVETNTFVGAGNMQDMFGTYSVDQLPVVCIRTPPILRIPRTLFMAVPKPREQDVNTRFGGSLVRFVLEGSEVLPPANGLVTANLSYDDTDAFYPTYSALDSAYGGYFSRDSDYSKAGYAS